MQTPVFSQLLRQLHQYPALAGFHERLESTTSKQELLTLYEEAVAPIEDVLWSSPEEGLLSLYHQFFQELEKLAADTAAKRHRFVIVIPVADRPRHLSNCLNSLVELQQCFHYGHNKALIHVIVADDSRQPEAIQQHQHLVDNFKNNSIEINYFGWEAQLATIATLPTEHNLSAIIGNHSPEQFFHKGASITRNITYLYLSQLADEDTLFYFIDSDQEFKVNIDVNGHDHTLYGINYFYHLNRIFSERDIEILTGKVVGDPPVSPAVMAGNFMNDVASFLQQLSRLTPEDSCSFHTQQQRNNDDAAYHDMADLFGFKQSEHHFEYHCPITGQHNHQKCVEGFAQRLNSFFDGEHPTRKTFYEHQSVEASLTPARTIYTGNYIFRPSALRYFIPFAPLKLRMAGPTLGRIIKSDSGTGFVSANLPMLHNRTVDDSGVSEFRAGVDRSKYFVDLSNEFERQYFGDVMLFSIERLTAQGYPQITISSGAIANTAKEIEIEMQQRYLQKQQVINTSMQQLQQLLDNHTHWWHQSSPGAVRQTQHFIDTIRHNFKPDSKGYQMIESATHCEERLNQIIKAITEYPQQCRQWQSIMEITYEV